MTGMTSGFTSKFFANNRRKLKESLNLANDDIVLIPAHVKLQKSHDEAYPFRQDSNFVYLTGINEPDCLLVITATTELLLSPPVSSHHQLWEGQAGLEALQQTSGVDDVLTGKTANNALRRFVTQASQIYVPSAYDSRALKTYYRMVANPARANLIRRIKTYKPKAKIVDVRPALSTLRMMKQPQEIQALQQAIGITLDSIETVQKNLSSLKTEHELQALLEYEFLRRGADGPSFSSIVASGAHSAQIHYERKGVVELDRRLVLLDVGAQVDGYKADISRILHQAPFTPRQQQIYQAVEELQSYAMSLLKPGTNLFEYEDLVDKKADELTKNLRVTKHKTLRRRERVIPHGVSHHLGLDTHDVADYNVPLQPDMVLTVEPGIYLPEEGIGVRIEDDVLITKSGIKNLSAPLL